MGSGVHQYYSGHFSNCLYNLYLEAHYESYISSSCLKSGEGEWDYLLGGGGERERGFGVGVDLEK
jgi:hypothetical protein